MFNYTPALLVSHQFIDPFYADVYSLCQFDGVDGSTDAIHDHKGLTWARTGTPSLETTDAKHGSASLKMTNTDYIQVASSAANAAAGAFTVEMWIKLDVTNQVQNFFSIYDNASDYISVRLTASNTILGSSRGNSTGVVASTLVAGQWAHLAFCKPSTGTTKLYVNGVFLTSNASVSGGISGTPYISIGNGANISGANTGIRGMVDGFRFTKGVERYPTAFTPSAFPWPTE